jgi:ABC-type multidrug transport system fused ATPase/permease subunit
MEALGNSDLLAALDAKESSEEGFARKNEVLKNESRIALFSASWTNPTTRLVNNTIYALVGIGGIVLIGLTRDQNATLLSLGALMTIGRLSSFLSYTNQYTKPFNEISGVGRGLRAGRIELRPDFYFPGYGRRYRFRDRGSGGHTVYPVRPHVFLLRERKEADRRLLRDYP